LASNIKLSKEGETSLSITNNSYYKLQLINSLNDLSFIDVKTKEGIFTQITVNDYGYGTIEGDPKLPVLKRIIELPFNCEFDIRIIKKSYKEYDLKNFKINYLIIPAQPPVSKNIDNPEELEFIFNMSTYEKNEYLYTDLVNVKPLGIMRGVRIARLEISPIQYNPVLNKLRIYDDIEVEITYKGADVFKTMELKKNYFSPYFENIYSQLLNYKPFNSDELIMDEPVTYIIVSDRMFETALQPFIEWKIKKGFYIIEAYTDDPSVGNTTSSIKSYLQNLYNNPPAGYNPQSFVLFVGDVAQIASFNGTAGSHVTDLYYCEYTGDIYPECYYGRFSANNLSELQPQIDKTLEYEQYLMPDPTFLNEVVMVAGADASHATTWGNGQINYGTTNYFNAAHGIFSHTYLQPEPSGGNYSQLIRQNVSDGVSFANYTAHCGPSGWSNPNFTISHISQLQNDHKYPLMIGNCCSSLEFQTTCFGEEVLRAANKGALGYIGGSNSTYWDEDFWWGVGFESISANPVYNPANLGAYDRTFHDHGEILDEWYVTQGQMPSAGNLAVTQSGSSRETYYWEIYHLMGDPSLMIYFSEPPVTFANYDALMPLSSTSFTVTTEPYAYVAISKDGVLHGAAIADITGIADVSLIPITVPGTADVIVTRQNGQPFIGTVVVTSPQGPYMLFNSYQIDDNSGNNNGLADYGENIFFDITLENVGSSTATNVSAILSTTDTYVTITDNSQLWPDIPSGATSTQNGAYAVTIADFVPDQHNVIFHIEITDGTEVWNSNFNITLYAPILSIGNLIIDDATGGNGNGRLDPDETVDLIVPTSNIGNSDALNALGNISSVCSYITINNATCDIGTLTYGNTENAVFNITVHPDAPIGTNVDINYDVTAGTYNAQKTFIETVGIIVEDFETGGFGQFNWTASGDAPWTIDDTAPYEGVYCAKSGMITHNQISELCVSFTIVVDDSISFYKKISSENNYDYLIFYIDDNEIASWCGEEPWSLVTFPVTAGDHTFKWVYDKDYSVNSGSDCVWIDYIKFPPINTSAILSVGNLVIDDTGGGNGNGFLDPGETADIIISSINTGLSTAENANAQISSVSCFITINSASANLGDILPMQTVDAVFNISVSASVPIGTIIDLIFDITAQSVTAQKTFYEFIGDISIDEDFETGDFTQFEWTMGGDANWTITDVNPYEGVYCAMSGDITNYETSELFFTMNVLKDDIISFYRKVSSESNYDWLRFYIDDEQIERWSGEVTWEQVSYPVSAGIHTFKWAYTKDGSVSSGDDCVWIDFIDFPPFLYTITVDLTVFVEGPYNGSDMNTYLINTPDFPLSQPYNAAPWNYQGDANLASIPANVVDWVLIELRETSGDASTAISSTMIAKQVALLLSNGAVVELDGSSPLVFNVKITENLFAVIYHRNHLGVMSAFALSESGDIFNYNFSTGENQVYGGSLGHKEIGTGVWGMVGGDGNPDGQITNSDKVDVWVIQSGNSGYFTGDFNLNSQVNNSDKIEVWLPNSGSGTQIPDNMPEDGFKSQIPK
ncbi:MAG: hypothetical protein K8R58_01170, partial [Bacteroidales bacterium]|nr:hypothetical protein [Bacteroidales bacterium]